MSNQPTPAEIAAELVTLHEFKDRKYRMLGESAAS